MPQLNRPLTKDEMEKLLMAMPIALFNTSIIEACYEDRHDVVSYLASADRVQYHEPEIFYWNNADTSPSDCIWMVPGTVRPWWKR